MSTASGDVSDGCVSVYEDCNYTGYYVKTCSEDIKMVDVALGGAVSSIQLGGGDYAYVFCRSTDFCTWSPEADVSCLGGWNNLLTYVRPIPLAPNCAILYENTEWKGTSYTICSDELSFSNTTYSGTVRSVLFGKNVASVTFYMDDNYAGASYTMTASHYNVNIGCSNTASSMKITT
eukprot:CAMPEP_0115009596 /NCGR_PEP_ID=MMETSP0216-20121206/22731_1 /TAXON_ID=223996 /ORGANISM="Protocruzia adherens, Strain Boccale" /LENGTH=176 /DNA_ID=CAMNT_0002377483 /DNA_START=260 /DNA_END=790 /DNA_ORIENTATION=-